MKDKNINIRLSQEEKNAYLKEMEIKNYTNLTDYILSILRKFYKKLDRREFKQ